MATPVPVTVTITSVEYPERRCDPAGIEAAGESSPDFYAKIFINGMETQTNREPDDRLKFEPTGWTASVTVMTPSRHGAGDDPDLDHDSSSRDDLADARPDPTTTTWIPSSTSPTQASGPDPSTSCATATVRYDDDEYYPMKVVDITAGADQDGDGLMDDWETSASTPTAMGRSDIDLPLNGASPTHQDVFLKLDYEATPAATARYRRDEAAFALAPGHPDGNPRINLHVDAATFSIRARTRRDWAGACRGGVDDDGDGQRRRRHILRYLDSDRRSVPRNWNGVDDDGDSQMDGNDPNAGSATISAAGRPCQRSGPAAWSGLASTKAAQFNGARPDLLLRHQAAAPTAPPRAPPLTCRGGEGEIGGNDFISHNRDPGTLMHEIGHNLKLRTAAELDNCKPNYCR